MATLKDVELKIAGVKKTKQITKAMNMVATSRLRGAQNAMEGFRPYAAKFAEVLGSLAQKAGGESNPLLVPREEVKRVHIVLCTSDRGLCGGFNVGLVNAAHKFMEENKDKGLEFSFTAFGKRGRDWCRKRKLKLVEEHVGIMGGKIGFNIALKSGRTMVDAFLDESYDEVYLIYSEFVSMGKQVPTVKQILPIPPLEDVQAEEVDENEPYQAEHICEPSPDELLGELLPRNVYVQIFSGLLETSTSEHAARMAAMDNATKACSDMIESLTLAYNKARQAAVTADLMDIVCGAEALKG